MNPLAPLRQICISGIEGIFHKSTVYKQFMIKNNNVQCTFIYIANCQYKSTHGNNTYTKVYTDFFYTHTQLNHKQMLL
ncbi:hypothetical protein GDO86_002277 [Hymenochirus boettgeri]|uniref:Uncharacterized protein n=1 Tax=Hymenochirus boettgeri TaxID=247094 RepID=A0A8T2KJE6_9PIPI|nr:hypothetical protein GDO86_002277 [Hymenochirus boettgeri]